ncbi:MAG: type VI secretion system membrane subunit TssM [Alphaproteobacteria bacterium]|jgi:type VI secretion system protein ImpL|nr:type VI secretion system membrane subunit TssM [Alphaproteobacteria bacterium]
MRKLATLVQQRWVLTLVGALVLSLVVWFVGPLVAVAGARPLGPGWARLLVVLVIMAGWGVLTLVRARRERARRGELAEGLGASAADDGRAAAADELSVLEERLDQAVDALRRAGKGTRRRGDYLYELPWYLLIGPPGAGKTTALVNAGLRFPLGEDREAAVRGVGGTRDCDWWFADEAILLDTAGRYTTQDSDEAADRAVWRGFLRLLRRARPRQPINGAFVVLGLAEFIAMDDAERQRHAATVRARLAELQGELGVRFPVYVLFTKADLLDGFVEFFDDLGHEERTQVWGATLPFDGGIDAAGAVAQVEGEFDALIERVSERALERIHHESDPERRGTIFAFPTQLAALKPTLKGFLDEVFRPTRLAPRFLLRGFYFASGTQEGRPIDRVMAAMSRALGFERSVRAHGRGGRAYFLRDLLRRVAFAEAGLVATNPRAERRERLARYGAAAAAGVILVGAGLAWAVSFTANRELARTVEARVADYQELTAQLSAADVNQPQPEQLLEPLGVLRDLAAGYGDAEAAPLRRDFGLDQGPKLGAQATAAYRRALEDLFLPSLVARVESQITAHFDDPSYLFEALKVYLMLGGEGPLDAALVREWFELSWQRRLGGPGEAARRRELAGHLDALLAEGVLAYELDDRLIRHTRERLRQRPLAERAYARIETSAAARELADWRLSERVGRGAAAIFVRGSGRSLDAPIDGLYTKAGFYDVFLPQLAGAIERTRGEAWVLGGARADAEVAGRDELRRRLLATYYRRYERAWRDLLQDLRFARPEGVDAMARLVNDLATPTSPAVELLERAAAQTRLAEPPQTSAAGAAEAAGEVAGEASTAPSSRLARAVGEQLSEFAARPGRPVEDAFADLHDFVEGDGLNRYLDQLRQVYRRLNAAAARGEDLDPALLRVDSSLPAPVAEWTRGLSGEVRTVAVGEARARFAEAWNGEVADPCREVAAGRYPFATAAARGAPLGAFGRVFGAGGLMERFFREHMQTKVDRSGEPWRWNERAAELGLPESIPEQFRRARAIRKAFFGLGGKRPQVTFSLEPLHLDPAAEQVTLVINTTSLSYSHGPPRSRQLDWPGGGSVRQARLSFRPPPTEGPGAITLSGPWAWFRLLDRAEIARSGAGRLRVTFTLGERAARFALTAHSVKNPFDLRALETFACPPRL